MTISSRFEPIIPDWPAPTGVSCLVTTRSGGVSGNAFFSLNLGDHVGDEPAAVTDNRAIVCRHVGGMPVWLNQVHGTRVVNAAEFVGAATRPEADASFSSQPGVACVVMTADCLPVLFCNTAGTVVAAAHAGWRGLLSGVLEATVAAMAVPGREIIAWLGPAIGPRTFEVGGEVRDSFMADAPEAAEAFKPVAHGKWLADIYLLARQRLARMGIAHVSGGDFCTVTEKERFFSYRRDGQTGRMASLIWLNPPTSA